MTASRYWIGIGALCALGWLAAPAAYAQADNYPQKPVTIISDAAPGSTPDVDARFIAAGLSKAWGQQVIIINHAGANGSIAARVAAEAAPDGYTLFMPALSTFVALQSVAPNLPLKLPRDFLPIGFTAENPMFVAVTPGLGVNSLPELIALAKKQPGTISIAVTGVGRLTHLTGLLLQDRAGIQLLPVPYNGGPAAALSDVGAGRVSMIIEGYSGIVGAIKAGQVKVIAVAAAQRLPQFPDLPTVAETLPGFSATGWQVLVAPRGTPAPIISKVSVDLAKVCNDPEFQKLLSNIGSYSRAMTADQALAFVEEQQRTWLPLLEKIPVK
ncbi:MAG TPA: tripartite tricarboxylate transporter substrate binding protein [Xanthobacteraceae bacterium]|jgi:tripartite-type tricarboxylate transporter receptor subunit TctC|nr:tripartite tricarboxylate transporter substrate binding protein [Xanthobacteraceae bacterium]